MRRAYRVGGGAATARDGDGMTTASRPGVSLAGMRRMRPRLPTAFAIAAFAGATCTGCDMLGSLFDTPPLMGIATVVVVVAVVGFLVSRGARRR